MTYHYATGNSLPKLTLKIGIILLMCVPTFAQVRPRGMDAYKNRQVQPENITPLKIGDRLPDALWHLPLQVINHPDGKETVTLDEYRGKLILLDFWNSACVPCIKAFPKLSDLQREFSGRLHIILSNRQTLPQLERLIQRQTLPDNLPCLVDQQTLHAHFPHRVVPHYVWIGQDGEVLATTSGDEINSENIKNMLTGHSAVPFKEDILTAPPYFLRPVSAQQTIVSYQLLQMGHYPGLPSKVVYHGPGTKSDGISVTNYRLRDLYKTALMTRFAEMGTSLTDNRCVVDITDSVPLLQFYTYERVAPHADQYQLDSLMLADLNAATPYHGRMEQREVTCYVIKPLTTGKQRRGDTPSDQPGSLRPLINIWNAAASREGRDALLIDESGFASPIDRSFHKIRDIATLRQALSSLGLDLIHTRRTLPMLVISEKPLIPTYPYPEHL